MKKILLSLCAAVLALTATAGTTPGLSYAWGKLIDGPTTAGDQATEVAVGKKGGIYWYGTYGSRDDQGLDITFGGETIFSGAHYSGTSQCPNFTLIKTDGDGSLLWTVYSNSGDFSQNDGGVVPTSDGGAVVVCRVRHTDGYTDRNISLIDATGAKTEVEWTCDRRFYRLMVVKVSAEGAISWVRMADASTVPGPGASGSRADFWADTFNLNGVAGDDSDNIYISLNFRNPLTVGKADGGSITFTPSESDALKTWTGDPQSVVGDFLLLSLDADGYYRRSLTLEGSAAAGYCQRITVGGGKVYAQGYVKGDGSALKAGGFSFTPTADGVPNPLLLCADTDLRPMWVKCFRGEKVAGKQGFQNTGLTVAGGTLWFCGMFNLKITDPDDATKSIASTQGNLREGFIIRLDAADGTWQAARGSRDDDWNEPAATAKTGLTGYYKVLQNAEKPGHIYVYGYVMNAQVGVFLRRYDAATLEADLSEGQNNVITGGGAPTSQTIAYDTAAGAVYLTARGNKAFTPMGGETSAAPKNWGVFASRFNLPDDMKTSGIDGIEADADAPAVYYNLQGIRIASPAPGTACIRVRAGRSEKIVVR